MARRSGLANPDELRRVGIALIELADALTSLSHYVGASLPIEDALSEAKSQGELAQRMRE